MGRSRTLRKRVNYSKRRREGGRRTKRNKRSIRKGGGRRTKRNNRSIRYSGRGGMGWWRARKRRRSDKKARQLQALTPRPAESERILSPQEEAAERAHEQGRDPNYKPQDYFIKSDKEAADKKSSSGFGRFLSRKKGKEAPTKPGQFSNEGVRPGLSLSSIPTKPAWQIELAQKTKQARLKQEKEKERKDENRNKKRRWWRRGN